MVSISKQLIETGFLLPFTLLWRKFLLTLMRILCILLLVDGMFCGYLFGTFFSWVWFDCMNCLTFWLTSLSIPKFWLLKFPTLSLIASIPPFKCYFPYLSGLWYWFFSVSFLNFTLLNWPFHLYAITFLVVYHCFELEVIYLTNFSYSCFHLDLIYIKYLFQTIALSLWVSFDIKSFW